MKTSIEKIIIILIIGLFWTSSCRTSQSTKNTTDLPNKLEHALLWKIEGKDIKTPSYLFGTIHIISKEDYFLPKGFLTAFDNVEKVFFEIDVDEMTDMSKIMGLMDKIMMSDGKTLKDLLSDEDYEIVNQHFQKIGMPLMLLERMKPMFLEIFALDDMKPGDIQSGKMKSYEFELNDLAKQSDKPIAGLESIEFQLSVFDSIPYEFQAKGLVESIKMGSDNEGSLSKLTQIYKSMNIDAMAASIQGDKSQEAINFEEVLLINRNKNWIPIMAKAMRTEATMFAVGAGHLAGENGVINLLIKKGYKLSPIYPKK